MFAFYLICLFVLCLFLPALFIGIAHLVEGVFGLLFLGVRFLSWIIAKVTRFKHRNEPYNEFAELPGYYK